jgi:type IV secretory pathway VirB9-like protein
LSSALFDGAEYTCWKQSFWPFTVAGHTRDNRAQKEFSYKTDEQSAGKKNHDPQSLMRSFNQMMRDKKEDHQFFSFFGWKYY